MSNPASSNRPILFFSRGKGRGHAIPDAAIAKQLLSLQPDLDIVFVSYSTGSKTLKELGWSVIDLELPEDNSVWDMMVKAVTVIRAQNPILVVSHEEFCAIPAAKAFGIPAVFLTDWLPTSAHVRSLEYADEIIFLDDPGYFDVPPSLAGKISYVSPIFRTLECKSLTKAQSRTNLGIPLNSTVILGAPGAAISHSESQAPIFDLVLASYELLDLPSKMLIWVVGAPDYEPLAAKSQGRNDVLVMEPHSDFIATMRGADLVITKGNRVTVFEAESLGIPSISISFGNNPVDDYRVCRIRSNTALRARGLDKMLLKHHMLKALANACEIRPLPSVELTNRCLAAVNRLRSHLPTPI